MLFRGTALPGRIVTRINTTCQVVRGAKEVRLVAKWTDSQKAAALMIAETTTISEAARETGIPEGTINVEGVSGSEWTCCQRSTHEGCC